MAAVERQSHCAFLLLQLHPALCLILHGRCHRFTHSCSSHPQCHQPWPHDSPSPQCHQSRPHGSPSLQQRPCKCLPSTFRFIYPADLGLGSPFPPAGELRDSQHMALSVGGWLQVEPSPWSTCLGACVEWGRTGKGRVVEKLEKQNSFVVHHTLNKPELFCHPQIEWEFFFLFQRY